MTDQGLIARLEQALRDSDVAWVPIELVRESLDALRTPAPQEDDEARWRLIAEAITTPDLHTDLARLSAISAVVNSRRPLTEAEIARGQELAAKYGWEVQPAPSISEAQTDEQKEAARVDEGQSNTPTSGSTAPGNEAVRPFQGCQCPAGPGKDCPLTLDECEARTADRRYMELKALVGRLDRPRPQPPAPPSEAISAQAPMIRLWLATGVPPSDWRALLERLEAALSQEPSRWQPETKPNE